MTAHAVVVDQPKPGIRTWMTKELIDANASAGSLRHAIQNENRTQVLCNYTGDIAEAVTAFREGRPPAFR